jgi:hypothetical protein
VDQPRTCRLDRGNFVVSVVTVNQMHQTPPLFTSSIAAFSLSLERYETTWAATDDENEGEIGMQPFCSVVNTCLSFAGSAAEAEF